MTRGVAAEPRIGVVMAARDAAATLGWSLDALDGAARIVVAVDPADRPTWAVAAARADVDPRVDVVANPGGRTAVGLNRALEHVRTPLVARVDAHAAPHPDYLPLAARELARTGAAVVGGLQVGEGAGPVGRAVATAMGTWAGSGGAAHRRGRRAGPADTAYLGVFDRAWLDRVGGWDDRLDRNQDYDVCHRIARAGGVVWFDPALEVRYRPRESWGALAVQYHEFGRWKRHVMTAEPSSVRLRQVLPALLPVGLAAAAGLAVAGRGRVRSAAAVVPTAWGLTVVGAAARAGHPLGWPLTAADRVRTAGALAVMHLAWGTGFWRGGRGGPRGRQSL